jgi:hypothetical protein
MGLMLNFVCPPPPPPPLTQPPDGIALARFDILLWRTMQRHSPKRGAIVQQQVGELCLADAGCISDDSSGATEIAPDHPDPRMGLSLLAEAFATTDVSFVVGLISQLADAGTRRRKVGERELNFMLAVVKGAKPKDQMEAMLAAQMAAVHMATMALARRLANVENVAQQDSAERALNKLARTFAAQVEARVRKLERSPRLSGLKLPPSSASYRSHRGRNRV